jgi:hypothetical protein
MGVKMDAPGVFGVLLVFGVLSAAIVIVPLWVAMKKAGLNPRWALLGAIPIVGLAIALLVLGLSKWPLVPEANSNG